jgi:hypothetical protein
MRLLVVDDLFGSSCSSLEGSDSTSSSSESSEASDVLGSSSDSSAHGSLESSSESLSNRRGRRRVVPQQGAHTATLSDDELRDLPPR